MPDFQRTIISAPDTSIRSIVERLNHLEEWAHEEGEETGGGGGGGVTHIDIRSMRTANFDSQYKLLEWTGVKGYPSDPWPPPSPTWQIFKVPETGSWQFNIFGSIGGITFSQPMYVFMVRVNDPNGAANPANVNWTGSIPGPAMHEATPGLIFSTAVPLDAGAGVMFLVDGLTGSPTMHSLIGSVWRIGDKPPTEV